jgi:hypothetical protein
MGKIDVFGPCEVDPDHLFRSLFHNADVNGDGPRKFSQDKVYQALRDQGILDGLLPGAVDYAINNGILSKAARGGYYWGGTPSTADVRA